MNKYTKALLLTTACCSYYFASAQNYNWEAHPKMHTVPEAFKKESAVLILEKRKIKYAADQKKEDIDVYRTVHRIISMIDDKGVEYFNKMTIAAPRGAEILDVKGRTIKANGKVIDLKKDQIRTMNDEHGQLQYHLAFEGVEKGDEVEMYYTEKRSFQLFGTETMQFGLPVAKASFSLEVPAYLHFDSKGYNNFPDATDTVIGNTHYYTSEQPNLDAIEEETYSDMTPNLKRIEYKLSYSGDSKVRLYTWNDLAKRMYEMNYTFTEKELKAADKFLAPLNPGAIKDEEEKIKRIEEAIKKEIVFDEQLRDDDYSKLNVVLEKKTAGESGTIRLFTACLQAAGIKHELGLSSNRFEYPLDDKFENWNRTDEYVFYFPKTQAYLSPTAGTLRYPAVPAFIRENKAVFCKITTVGDMTSALASVRTIPVLPLNESANTIKAEVSFDKESMTPSVQLIHGFKGYSAFGMREAVTLIPKDKEKELVQGLTLGMADQPEDIVKYSFTNSGLEHYSDNKPLEINCEIKAEQLMETAGGKWLFKVGDVIGPQEEMYQDKKRKLPISMPFPHSLIRDIVINIPEGYKITNPESVKFDEQVQDASMGFTSSYTMQGKKMIIHINEFYSKDFYPATEIEPFRKVINAAADFNKVTLVMEKE